MSSPASGCANRRTEELDWFRSSSGTCVHDEHPDPEQPPPGEVVTPSGEAIVEALIVLDVISDFDHEDGDRLLASLRERSSNLERALAHARARELDIIYVNDAHGRWDGERSAHIDSALAAAGGETVRRIAPREGDRFLFKGAYSAFNGTPLRWLLAEREVGRIILTGAATEMCVAQTAISAREDELQVTVLADACATIDPYNETTALEYLARVTGSVIASVEGWREGNVRPVDGLPARRETASG
jgi:nicotinamidase-related amidase